MEDIFSLKMLRRRVHSIMERLRIEFVHTTQSSVEGEPYKNTEVCWIHICFPRKTVQQCAICDFIVPTKE